MPQVNQLGGSAVVNVNVNVEKPKPAAKKRRPGVHYCPACDVECVAEDQRTHIRFSCPNGTKCPTGGFYVDDHDAKLKPVDAELMAGLDAPSDHRLQHPGVAG